MCCSMGPTVTGGSYLRDYAEPLCDALVSSLTHRNAAVAMAAMHALIVCYPFHPPSHKAQLKSAAAGHA